MTCTDHGTLLYCLLTNCSAPSHPKSDEQPMRDPLQAQGISWPVSGSVQSEMALLAKNGALRVLRFSRVHASCGAGE